MELYHGCDEAKYPEDSRAAFLVLFTGGFRVSEALQITRSQVKYNDKAVVIYRAPVLKKKRLTLRNVVAVCDDRNPLAKEFIEYVEDLRGEYLLPRRVGPLRLLVPDEPTSRMTLWRRVYEATGLFPHALRAYRAMHLVSERGFNPQQLVSWFEWKNADMALHYTRTREIAASMGLEPGDVPV